MIEKDDYTLVVGYPDPYLRTVRFIFDGWSDPQMQAKFYGDLKFFEEEVVGGNVNPVPPCAKAIVNLICREGTKNENIERGDTSVSPPVGTLFDLTYNPTTAKVEDIEDFFRSSGIAFHRAEPFEKPRVVKSWWQWLKEKF